MKISERLKRLKYREKVFLILFGTGILFNIYLQSIYKPLSRSMVRYILQTQKFMERMGELKSKFPQIDEQKREIQSLNKESKKLLNQISDLEKALPSQGNIAQLASEFLQQTKEVKLFSLHQKMVLEKEYPRIFIELKFNATYKDIVNYIRRLETISPFLRIDEMELLDASTEAKEASSKLLFSSLLGKLPSLKQLKTKEGIEPIVVPRDIFVSKARTVSRERKKELKLEGITYSLNGPTAIINGQVVREDSEIENLRIKQIVPEAVIITDGIEEYVLTIER